jgi:hypothetical protein
METWKTATDRPGYRCKTVQRGMATIVIYRPILTEAQEAKAQKRARTMLESAMRDYMRGKGA